MPATEGEARQRVLLDAGVLIGALLKGDPRHLEARPLVERARRGELPCCTTAGIEQVFTYDVDDWRVFEPDGLTVVGPQSVLAHTQAVTSR